jgi:hypothetical protein
MIPNTQTKRMTQEEFRLAVAALLESMQDNHNPWRVVVAKEIWNGYWYVGQIHPLRSVVFRWLGKTLKSRRLYWIGLPIRWVEGLKDIAPKHLGYTAMEGAKREVNHEA